MATIKDRLTIEQLEQERCFIDLTPKQQMMVRTFIGSNGDRVLAVLSAYQVKSPEVARVLAYEFFENPKVIACLTVYFQDDPFEVFKEDVRRAMHNKRLTVAQVQAMKLYCDMNGWKSASLPRLNGCEPVEPEGELPRFKVNDIAILDGTTKIRVTAVDDVGRAIEGEPIA